MKPTFVAAAIRWARFRAQQELFMARPGITGADVVRAYVALQKQRRAPTIVNIRLELGRGSFTTIAERLEALALLGRGGRYARRGPPKVRGRPARIERVEAQTEN